MSDEDVKTACWEFNEAVSMLREARQVFVPSDSGLAVEIDEGLPAIQAALEALAEHVALLSRSAAEPPEDATSTTEDGRHCTVCGGTGRVDKPCSAHDCSTNACLACNGSGVAAEPNEETESDG